MAYQNHWKIKRSIELKIREQYRSTTPVQSQSKKNLLIPTSLSRSGKKKLFSWIKERFISINHVLYISHFSLLTKFPRAKKMGRERAERLTFFLSLSSYSFSPRAELIYVRLNKTLCPPLSLPPSFILFVFPPKLQHHVCVPSRYPSSKGSRSRAALFSGQIIVLPPALSLATKKR